ncbi:MAG TPA: histidine kinase [Chitinophagaceae bacterium]|nr:histidine kinase [Chitinophagaceae bacterium]
MLQTEIYLALILSTCIVFIFIAGIVLFILQYRKRKIQYQSEKKAMELLHLNEMKEATLQMQQLTMQDIGREIHDGVGQRLTLASIYSKQLLHKNLSEENQLKMEEISNIINESLVQLRLLSRELANEQEHSIDIDELFVVEIEKVKALAVCDVEFTGEKEFFIDNKKAMFIIRILQEFMQNSLKYAECTQMFISLKKENDCLVLNLSDNGKGFDLQASTKGIGLHNMKRRAEMIGASMEISSSIGLGTSLHLQLPL